MKRIGHEAQNPTAGNTYGIGEVTVVALLSPHPSIRYGIKTRVASSTAFIRLVCKERSCETVLHGSET